MNETLSKATRLYILQLKGPYELVSDGKDGTGTLGEIRKNGAVVFSGSCSACIEHAIKIGIWYQNDSKT